MVTAQGSHTHGSYFSRNTVFSPLYTGVNVLNSIINNQILVTNNQITHISLPKRHPGYFIYVM